MKGPSFVREGLQAGSIAALISGLPSTLHALLTGRDVLEATTAAGSLILPRGSRRSLLVMAAIPVHAALSLGWGILLAAVLPRRRTLAWGGVAGLAIAALDLGVVGRRVARVRALPVLPQVADHLVYGASVGLLLARLRGAQRDPWAGMMERGPDLRYCSRE